MTAITRATGGGWIEGWDPEDEDLWAAGGKQIARRNLIFSILSEHIGFSVWSIWSVLVLFMSPDIGLGFTASEKFLLVLVPNLVGALLRLPYAAAVTRFGGRNWTVFSSVALLVPALGAFHFAQQPGTPLWVFLLIGAFAGVGGGNFASSMTNITIFFPQRLQGWALGLNAGGGNIGVATIQVVGLLVIATAGGEHPSYVAAIYLPLIVLAAVCAALFMDNVDAIKAKPGALREACGSGHTWWLSLLYIGTFGSFIGFSFAFGLVLKTEFDFTALQAASWTFLGPLLGSVSRPVGGWLADKLGGARITLWNFVLMAAGVGVLLIASAQSSFPLYIAAFIVLFTLTGVGNGSTYKMIPAVFAKEAEDEVTSGGSATAAFARARRVSGAVIGIAGALGALGGVGINLAFRSSYSAAAGNGDAALWVFLAYYLVCVIITWAIYLRSTLAEPASGARPVRRETTAEAGRA
ncbi:nitrate/nitrite transporter [Saccharopolyspora griseoalba]|uniref:Nitrate/nitrite transporter n=1 Tax=Saccharopolyspora griseoalba TaxID=1431848 RepID=A0ABW2LD64_9PSEU